ncbi:inositol-1-monophosphatase [Oleiphilus messinensis]|uniref:Inositol-1-monophosphatase n=1 Tax=Oleiphilus messinensis TaxID=141451 RepID=A0A1Y0I7R6_9GAMM|nr:inositol monophosphatase family protein [Oleiphilus messinensis]ARU56538.1 inositol-1-monophosphatase [Oleiphilus messinensis]
MLPILNIAARTLRQASEFLQQVIERQEFVQEEPEMLAKKLLQIEKDIHRLFIQNIKKSFPEHYIAALGETDFSESDKETVWSLTPIHSGLNFAKGLPYTAISATCFVKGKAEHAIIINPTTGDEYAASKGRGASLNGKRIRVSSTKTVDQCLIATDALFNPNMVSSPHVRFDLYNSLSNNNFPLQQSNCPILDIANVAAGRIDAAVQLQPDVLDLQAAILICQEAGGLLGDLSGGGISSNSGQLVCANPKLFKSLLQKLYAFRDKV